MHRPSHIDYILVSKRSISRVQAFGIAALEDLMIDYDHSILFCDLDVTQPLELGERKPAAALPQRHKSQIRYSDKKRVARFRGYATDLYEKRQLLLRAWGAGSVGTGGIVAQQLEAGEGAAEAGARACAASEAAAHG